MTEITNKQHLSAMMDSVHLINQLVALNKQDKESLETLDRNYRHLEIMLAKDDVMKDCADDSCFKDAVANGRKHTGTPEGLLVI